jgi:hypothetical protein
MKLIFIYGAAAVGKLTVAKELARLTGFRLFHNHLTVDLVCAVFEFGTEPFVRLREQVWLTVFREAAKQNVSLIFTFAPERTVREHFIQDAIDVVKAEGGEISFVELTCATEERERRIENPSRSQFGKLNSLELYKELQRIRAFEFPELPNSGLSIDTTNREPADTARLIVESLALDNHPTMIA